MKSSLETISNNVSEGFTSFGDFWVDSYNSTRNNISQYFESKDYEGDLDSVIDTLYAHNLCSQNIERYYS